MTELADVGDSNSLDISRNGSNPFIRIRLIYYEEYTEGQGIDIVIRPEGYNL